MTDRQVKMELMIYSLNLIYHRVILPSSSSDVFWGININNTTGKTAFMVIQGQQRSSAMFQLVGRLHGESKNTFIHRCK